jgi:hypothetical protein
MTRAKAENTVTYKRRIGKVGAYGEHKVVTWDSANGVALARIYENNDGTVEVTLYSADNTPHPRTLPNDGQRCWNNLRGSRQRTRIHYHDPRNLGCPSIQRLSADR